MRHLVVTLPSSDSLLAKPYNHRAYWRTVNVLFYSLNNVVLVCLFHILSFAKSDCILQNKKAAKTLRLHDFTRTS